MENRITVRNLHSAVRRGDIETIRILLRCGDINVVDDSDWTALHCAAVVGKPDVVELLLQNHADVTAQNVHGCTPLHFAVKENNFEVVSILIAADADINAPSIVGTTPAQMIDSEEQLPIVELLLKSGVDVNATDNFGYSLLSNVVCANLINSTKILIENYGANPRCITGTQRTLLHIAAKVGAAEILDYLLSKVYPYVDINARDMYNDTPAHSAADSNKPSLKLFKTLKKFGADFHSKNRNNISAYDIMKNIDNPEIQEYIKELNI